MNKTALNRLHRIDEVVRLINEVISLGKDVDKKELTYEIMEKYLISRRTAQEYIDLAFRRLGT